MWILRKMRIIGNRIDGVGSFGLNGILLKMSLIVDLDIFFLKIMIISLSLIAETHKRYFDFDDKGIYVFCINKRLKRGHGLVLPSCSNFLDRTNDCNFCPLDSDDDGYEYEGDCEEGIYVFLEQRDCDRVFVVPFG